MTKIPAKEYYKHRGKRRRALPKSILIINTEENAEDLNQIVLETTEKNKEEPCQRVL
jgi:hypothetical protein